MDKVDSMGKQMGNKTERWKFKERTKKKRWKSGTLAEMRMPLMGLLVDWRWLRKEALSLRIFQQKPL